MAPTKTRQAYSEDDLRRAVNAVKEDGVTFAKQGKITREKENKRRDKNKQIGLQAKERELKRKENIEKRIAVRKTKKLPSSKVFKKKKSELKNNHIVNNI